MAALFTDGRKLSSPRNGEPIRRPTRGQAVQLIDDLTTHAVGEYRERIAQKVAAHRDMVTKGREAVNRLRAGADSDSIEFADATWGADFTPRMQRALVSGDSAAVSALFYQPIVAVLVMMHRETFEAALGDAVAIHFIGPGLSPFPPEFDADVVGRIDGLCMAVLKDFVDPHVWTALYRWAWTEFGPASPTVVELRAVA